MARSCAPQFRAMVIEQVRSGRAVAEVAADLQSFEATTSGLLLRLPVRRNGANHSFVVKTLDSFRPVPSSPG